MLRGPRVSSTEELLVEAQELIRRAQADCRGRLAPVVRQTDEDTAEIVARAGVSVLCTFSATNGQMLVREAFREAIAKAGRGPARVRVLCGDRDGGRIPSMWDFPHEVRPVPHTMPHCIAVDGSVVVISPSDGAWRDCSMKIDNEAFTGSYTALFQNLWSLADPGTGAPADGCPHCKVSAMIIRALSQGATDERAAPQLDMSVRTYRRHVARIMEELQVESRFQAGMKIAHEGMPCRHR